VNLILSLFVSSLLTVREKKKKKFVQYEKTYKYEKNEAEKEKDYNFDAVTEDFVEVGHENQPDVQTSLITFQCRYIEEIILCHGHYTKVIARFYQGQLQQPLSK
jgi:membrane-bound lytic murein transglycosylase